MPPDNSLILEFLLSHKLKSFKIFSIKDGLGAFPYKPRVYETLLNTYSNCSNDNSCGTKPISDLVRL